MNETDTVMDLNWTISNRRSTEVKEKEKLQTTISNRSCQTESPHIHRQHVWLRWALGGNFALHGSGSDGSPAWGKKSGRWVPPFHSTQVGFIKKVQFQWGK